MSQSIMSRAGKHWKNSLSTAGCFNSTIYCTHSKRFICMWNHIPSHVWVWSSKITFPIWLDVSSSLVTSHVLLPCRPIQSMETIMTYNNDMRDNLLLRYIILVFWSELVSSNIIWVLSSQVNKVEEKHKHNWIYLTKVCKKEKLTSKIDLYQNLRKEITLFAH